jgi:hypothetical protein
MRVSLFVFLLFSSIYVLAQNNIKYSVCVNFPKHDFDTNCRNHTIISTFDVNYWLHSSDLDSVRVFIGSENFKKNESVKGQLNLYDFNSVSYKEEKKNGIQTRIKTSGYIGNDTSYAFNIESDEPSALFIYNTRIVIEDQFSFQEAWKVDSSFEKTIGYYSISQKQDSFNLQFSKEFPTLFFKNIAKFNIDKLGYMIDISYRIPIENIDSNILVNKLLNDSYLFENRHLKFTSTMQIDKADSFTVRDIFHRYIEGGKHHNWNQIKNSKVVSMEFKEKWYWDTNGVLSKKVLGFGPVFQYDYNGMKVKQVPVYFRY